MKKLAFILVLTLIVVTVVIAVGLPTHDGRPHEGSRLRVLFSGESLGRLDPCICDGELAGGLAFRQGYVSRQPDPFLLLDVGCMVSGPEALAVHRGEAVSQAMSRLKYDAANVGEFELTLAADDFARLRKVGPPLVSANVVDASGKRLCPPSIRLRCGELDVTVVGVVSDRFRPCAGLTIEPPREALGRLIPELAKAGGVLVVLADLPLLEVKALAEDFPEVSLFLFRGSGDSVPPTLVNRSIVASIYGGRYLGDVTLAWSAPRRVSGTGEAVLLDKRFALAEQDADALRIAPPRGVTVSPTALDFGVFQRGRSLKQTLTITNANDGPVRLARVYSPCTCFVLDVPEREIAAGGSATIDVTLHSLSLSGRSVFPLYVQLTGAVGGILSVEATATVQGAAPAALETTP